ncbi:MAG: NADH-quinone oxidoreductase subunit J [Zavarzinella sp.]
MSSVTVTTSDDVVPWTVLVPVILGGIGVLYLLPGSAVRRATGLKLLAGMLAIAGLATFLLAGLSAAFPKSAETVIFAGFSTVVVIFALNMLSTVNAARAAISFAMVILGSCGLFLLLGAPFLSAVTVIIYAGAIIVTFLFVLMLSQQDGVSSADARTREPALSVIAGFMLLGVLFVGLQRVYNTNQIDVVISEAEALATADQIPEGYVSSAPTEMGKPPAPLKAQAKAFIERAQKALIRYQPYKNLNDPDISHHLVQVDNAIKDLENSPFRDGNKEDIQTDCRTIATGLKQLRVALGNRTSTENIPVSPYGQSTLPPGVVSDQSGVVAKKLPAANVAAIGRVLFSDHLLAVEMVGTLLLVATVGAIVISSRKEGQKV